MKTKGINRVLIIAGGTGGHIFPALAVAEILKSEGIEVYWLGSEVGLEKNLIPSHFPLICIQAKRLRGKGFIAYIKAPWQLLKSLWQAYQVIKQIKPEVVLAMGGYVCAPGGLAAKLAHIPLVVHEQNAVAGYTNRLLCKLAKVVLAAYPGAFADKSNAKIIGNPVRTEITQIPPPELRLQGRGGALRILVLGGSQGARAINRLMMNLVQEFANPKQIEIRHQTGESDFQEVHAHYARLPIKAQAQAFIKNMAEAYEWADLLICRAGALTVAEIAATGVASVLVPFPAAVDDHQWYNAQVLQQAGAAIICREKDLSVSKLSELLENFLQQREILVIMSQKARECAQPHAAAAVANVLNSCSRQ